MRYLVWSNRFGAWVRPERNGYSTSLDEAGYFTADDAEVIVSLENVGPHGWAKRVDPFNNREYHQWAAVMMAAPELRVPA